MSDVITVTADDCRQAITEAHAALDAACPDWRARLAACCLHCSDVAWPLMKELDRANNAQWLLDGTDWKRWRP